ncbi:unnamed protein product [marine sediment metagenome]|uniref:Phage tail collar domain-containing protein n=1 Tax=marine sediment metagenome TaxID=412755 RepID=X1H0P2_9ZZZZ
MMPGMIMLWYGEVETIPSGWTLCDGTMGTPDLRNRFVAGAGLWYEPGRVGGASSHTHTFTGDGHDHDIPQEPGCPGAGPNPCISTLKTSEDPAVGTTDSKEHLPLFHALCYIMKL